MADRPRVTIGLPVYNGSNYLATALGAILAQSFGDFRAPVSDNASTDDTEAICREFASRDDRIDYQRLPENLGAGPNYDRVFTLSDSEYFQWLAHDDLVYPEFLEKTVAALDADPDAVLAFTHCANIDPDGDVIDIEPPRPELAAPEPHKRLASAIYSGHNTYPIFGLMRSSAVRNTDLHGGYTGSDRVLLAQMAMAGTFVEVPEVLFGYRRHPEQSIKMDPARKKSGLLAHPREAWFDVTRASKIVFPNWKRLDGYLRAVRNSNVPGDEKRRTYREIGRWLTDSNWKKLVVDALTGLVQAVRRLVPRR